MGAGKTVNRFNKGLQSDLSVNVVQDETYLDARNIRIVTDSGLSTLALCNAKGNEFSVTVPTTSAVYSIEFIGNFGAPYTDNITINGLVDTFSSSATDFEQFYIELADFINNSAIYNPGATPDFNAYANPDKVILYSPTVLTNFTVVFATPADWTLTTIVSSITTPFIIGWTTIRDTIVLLTTDPNSVSATPTGESGQIWTLEYDPITDVPTITLKYNNILNFSRYWGVANQGQIEGRYEIAAIQRIYWTDGYNTPKKFNIANPLGFGLSVDALEWVADLDLSVPIVQEVIQSGGAKKIGIHQLTYRLTNVSGAKTQFAPLSNPIFINDKSETHAESEIEGGVPGASTGKAIRYLISGLDTSFDRIELVNVYRSSLTAIPIVELVKNEPLGTIPVFEVTITGLEITVPLTIAELEAAPVVFTRVKTISSKNNYLLPANVITSSWDVNFDARAYRYRTDTTTYSDPNDINPDQSPDSADPYIYQSNGTTYGGEGPNVKYEFTTTADTAYATFLDSHAISSPAGPAYASTAPGTNSYDLLATDEVYPAPNAYNNSHSPYVTSVLRGYHRDEVYRFGIVFFSKKGLSSFVKWIGDIRMPHMWMPQSAGAARTLDFPTYTYSAPNCIGWTLGIKFTIDVSSIQNEISGYSIVRVKRNFQDKTILDQGIMYPCFVQVNSGNYVTTLPEDTSWTYDPTLTPGAIVSGTEMSFNSPNFLFEGFPGVRLGDYMDVAATALNTEAANLQDTTFADLGSFKRVYKAMDIESTPAQPIFNNDPQGTFAVVGAFLAPSANSLLNPDYDFQTQVGTAVPFKNRTENQAATPGVGAAMGGKTLLMYGTFTPFGTGTGSYTNTDTVTVDLNATPAGVAKNFYITNYKRVTTQYGGNTITDRSKNIYQSCNHFQHVSPTDNPVKQTIVFGGDTYINVFDNVKQFPNYFGGAWADGFYAGRLIPLECTINTDLRTGPRVFKRQFLTNGTTGSTISTDEQFDYYPVFDAENSIISYFPEPIPFILNNEFDTRIYASEKKVNGELTDSWTNFKTNTFIDVEGLYGPINNLIVSKDKVYYFQDKGFGIVSIDTRSLIQDASGTELQLGIAGLLSRFDYISTEAGCKHQWGMTVGNTNIYFADAIRKVIWKFMPDEGLGALSVIKGLSGFFANNLMGDGMSLDKPLLSKGFNFTYDYDFDDALFTFQSVDTNSVTHEFTVAYNEIFECFTSFYDFLPYIYVNPRNRLLSTENGTDLYQHNIGAYGVYYGSTPFSSTVKFINNTSPGDTKKYNVFTWITESIDESNNNAVIGNETWDRVRTYNNRQNSDWVTLVTKPNTGYNISSLRKREWTSHVPRNAVLTTLSNVDIFSTANLDQTQQFKDRMSDLYMITDLEYFNTNNYRFICPAVQTDILKVY